MKPFTIDTVNADRYKAGKNYEYTGRPPTPRDLAKLFGVVHMNTPCEWCQSTSEQIDSLEHLVEDLAASVADMKHRNTVLCQRQGLPVD